MRVKKSKTHTCTHEHSDYNFSPEILAYAAVFVQLLSFFYIICLLFTVGSNLLFDASTQSCVTGSHLILIHQMAAR